jgi:hypothetical protein
MMAGISDVVMIVISGATNQPGPQARFWTGNSGHADEAVEVANCAPRGAPWQVPLHIQSEHGCPHRKRLEDWYASRRLQEGDSSSCYAGLPHDFDDREGEIPAELIIVVEPPCVLISDRPRRQKRDR